MRKYLLEICSDSIESALAAQRGGADRLELCSALDEGGITPSYGYVQSALNLEGIRKNVLIRPRGGDFIYTPKEVDVMIADIKIMKELGVDGVVIGALNKYGELALPETQAMIEAAQGLEVTFHRAFDMCAEPFNALEQLINLGCHRILTSGMSSTALAGADNLKKLVELAKGRISIMPGCGVNAGNAAAILGSTGAYEIHASARSGVKSCSEFRIQGVSMGASDRDEYFRKETSEQEVAAIKAAISTLGQ